MIVSIIWSQVPALDTLNFNLNGQNEPLCFFCSLLFMGLNVSTERTNLLIMVNCIFLRMKGKCQRKKEYCEAPQISCTLHFSFEIPARNKKLCIKSIIYCYYFASFCLIIWYPSLHYFKQIVIYIFSIICC